jgi:hypothetical protein
MFWLLARGFFAVLGATWDTKKKHKMFQLVAHCPTTGGRIPLRIEMGRGAFTHSASQFGREHCPHCPESHTWQKEEVILEPSVATVAAQEAPRFRHFLTSFSPTARRHPSPPPQ